MIGYQVMWAYISLLTVAQLSLDVSAQIPGDGKFDIVFCEENTGVCPFPLVCANADTKEELNFFNCTFPCTGTMSTEAEIAIFEELTLALSGVGLILSSFLTLTWGIFKEKSKQKMTFWLSFSSLMMTAAIFWPTVFKAGKPSDVWCKDANDGFRQEDGISLCAIQGFFIIFFGLAFCAWWFCSCIDIFAKLYLRKRHIEHWLSYYHYFAWSTSTTSAFLLLFLQHYGFEQPRLWCFLDADADDYVEYLFFYIPIGIQWLIGTIMMLLVILRVIRRAAKSQQNNGLFNKIKLYQTPIAFVVVFNFIWAVFVSFRFLTLFGEDDYIESATSWVTCLLGSVLKGISSEPGVDPAADDEAADTLIGARVEGEVGCGTVQPGRIDSGLFGLTVFTLAGNGILLFFIFGFNRENFTLWSNAIRESCCCCESPERDNPGSQTGSKIRSLYDDNVPTFYELKRGFVSLMVMLFRFVTCKEQERRGPQSRPVVRFADGNAETWNYGNNAPKQHPGTARQQEVQSKKPRYFFNPAIASESFTDNREPQQQYNSGVGSYYASDFSDDYVDPLWGI